jgi:hypothetical protein
VVTSTVYQKNNRVDAVCFLSKLKQQTKQKLPSETDLPVIRRLYKFSNNRLRRVGLKTSYETNLKIKVLDFMFQNPKLYYHNF